jgi:hypothetical protein
VPVHATIIGVVVVDVNRRLQETRANQGFDAIWMAPLAGASGFTSV